MKNRSPKRDKEERVGDSHNRLKAINVADYLFSAEYRTASLLLTSYHITRVKQKVSDINQSVSNAAGKILTHL